MRYSNFFFNLNFKKYVENTVNNILIYKYPKNKILKNYNLNLKIQTLFTNIKFPEKLFISRIIFSFFFLTNFKPKVKPIYFFNINRIKYYKFSVNFNLNSFNVLFFYNLYLTHLYNYFKNNNLLKIFILSKNPIKIGFKFKNYKILSELKPYRAFFSINIPLYLKFSLPHFVKKKPKSFLSLLKFISS